MASWNVLSQDVSEVTEENQGNCQNKGPWRDFNKEFCKYKDSCPQGYDALQAPVLPPFSEYAAVSFETLVLLLPTTV